MLMFNVKKNLSLLLPKINTTTNLLNFVRFSSKTLTPSPQSNPVAESLMNSCGFSSQKAASAAKVISKFTSVEQADSVRHFFKHHGFDDTSILRLISNMPRILVADVDKTLKPNIQTLHEMGFAKDDLRLLAVSNPPLLVSPLAIPRLEFWQNFLGTNDREVLVRVFRRNRNFIGQDILKEHGLSQADIIGILLREPCLIGLSSRSIEALLKKAKELGLHSHSSSMLARGMSALCCIRSGKFNAKMEIFKGFGWSEEFLGALKKSPNFITFSEDSIIKKMEFLLGRVG